MWVFLRQHRNDLVEYFNVLGRCSVKDDCSTLEILGLQLLPQLARTKGFLDHLRDMPETLDAAARRRLKEHWRPVDVRLSKMPHERAGAQL